MNSHNAAPDLVAELAGIGIRWHRIDINWDEIEREEGQFDWTSVNSTIEAAQEHHLSLLGSIAYTPWWASGAAREADRERAKGLMPRDTARFVQFVDAVLDRYRGRIQCLAVWNEPNLLQFFQGTRRQYLEGLLLPGLQRIADRAPEVVRCGPDLSSSRKSLEWLADILDAAGPLLDVITHHQYDGDDTVEGRTREIERLRRFLVDSGYGDRPLWITEIGWDTPPAEQQAQLLRGTMTTMLRRSSWQKTFWYDSHGPGWGLLGPDATPERGKPRASFDAYREIVASARG